MKKFKFLSLAILGLTLTKAGWASFTDVTPTDADQAVRLRIVAPKRRNLPSAPEAWPAINIWTGSNDSYCRGHLKFGLAPHKIEVYDDEEGQVPLQLGTSYCIDYAVTSGDHYNHFFVIFQGNVKSPLDSHTITMERPFSSLG